MKPVCGAAVIAVVVLASEGVVTSNTHGFLERPTRVRAWATVPGATQAVPGYDVRRARGAVQIDGHLNDPAWASASPAVSLQPLWESQTGVKQTTTARLLWDDQFLYVGYDCEDVDITAVLLQRDDPTYRDDAVEIFINPRPSQTGLYYGLEMNARGVLYDYVMYESRIALKRFNTDGTVVATSLRGSLNASGDRDAGWSLEVAVPWVNFEEFSPRPVPGTTWTANLNRWDGVAPHRRMSIWSDPQRARPEPHVPARFGELVFVP